MAVSATRLAEAIATRLSNIAPAPFMVSAVDGHLCVDHPDERGFINDFNWMEEEDRPDHELLQLAASNALNSFQDSIAEATTEPWPLRSE